jgi:hypothetical protein
MKLFIELHYKQKPSWSLLLWNHHGKKLTTCILFLLYYVVPFVVVFTMDNFVFKFKLRTFVFQWSYSSNYTTNKDENIVKFNSSRSSCWEANKMHISLRWPALDAHVFCVMCTHQEFTRFYIKLVGTHDLRPLGSPPISLNWKGPWTKAKTKNMTVDV